MHYGRALHEREVAFLRCKAVLPRASPRPRFVRWLARLARLSATTLALSGEEAQHARLLRAHAPPRWWQSLHAPWKGTARARSRPFSLQGWAPTCRPWPAFRGVACACSALVRHCAGSLCGGGVARASATCARAAPRWLESVRVIREATAPARSLVPSVQGRAPRGQLRPPMRSPLSCDRGRARHCAGSLWGGGTTRAPSTRARAVPRWSESTRFLRKATAPARNLPPSMQGRAPTCHPRPPTRSPLSRDRARARHCARSLLRGGAARALAALVCSAALVGVEPCPMEAHCASETALSLGARPCSDVPSTASNEQPAFACAHTRTRHWACSLSGGGAARALAARARSTALVIVGSRAMDSHCASEKALSLGARPCSDALSTASNEQPAFACAHTRTRH